MPVLVGWQYTPPARAGLGPAPQRPVIPRPVVVDEEWAVAQRQIVRRLERPARLGAVASVAAAMAFAGAWFAGLASASLAAVAVLALLSGLVACARSLRRGRRRLETVIASQRRAAESAGQEWARRFAAVQQEHASSYRAWQRRKAIADRRPAWFAVHLPAGIHRLDVVGGTLAGWSALLTTIGAGHLSAGGEMTIVDLTEGAVAAELTGLAGRSGLRPLVWMLPADLPRFELGADLGPEALAGVLTVAASASAQPGSSSERPLTDLAGDCALLERVLSVLGPRPRVAHVTAALRALSGVGDPRTDVRSGLLTSEQLDRIGTLFGRGATERVVIDRAWALESRLRALDALGSAPVRLRPSRIRVAALDRRAGLVGNLMLGSYLVASLTHLLRDSPSEAPWRHVLCVLGAERLNSDAIDRLADACEMCGTGLVITYRSMPGMVRERLGRGDAAIAFMRLGNGDDARVASELIGTEHRFVVGQLTDTVGTSVTDTWTGSYTSTAGTADSVTDSTSVSRSRGASHGQGRSRPGGFAPFGEHTRSASRDSSFSVAGSESVSLTEGINSSTSWGLNLSRAIGENASLGRTVQRSREFLVESEALQRLPQTAAIVSYPAPAGRTVVLADVNPAIGTLSGAAPRWAAGSRPDEDEGDWLEHQD